MRKVKVITDSTNDLSTELLQEYDISVVPLYVDFGEESYKDGVDLTTNQLFKMVDQKGILPKTSAPSPYDLSELYKQYIDQDFDIVMITISSEISSTYQNAVLAASDFPTERIWVVDSRSLSTGIGILVMAAGDCVRKGMEAKEVAETIREMTPKVKVSFVIDTLEYLYKGGRCNAVENLIGSMLKIRPIIGLSDGKMIVIEKVRGEKSRALDKMISEVLSNKNSIHSNRILITNSQGSEEEVSYLKNYLKNALPTTSIYTTSAGCVISSHCGLKTIGVIYLGK